jgi:glycosyltransferase involved in cell wall biosynthesis
MRIAIFTDSFFPKIDGIAVSVQGFCEKLEARGHKFVICCPRYGEDDSESMGENIAIERFNSVALPSYAEMRIIVPGRRRLHRVIKNFKPDLIHIQTPGFMGQYGVAAGKLYSIPVVGTYHTMMSEVGMYVNPLRLMKLDKLLSRFRRKKKIASKLAKLTRKKPASLGGKLLYKLANRLYEKCAIIVSPSELIKKDLIDKNIKAPVTVISNGIDLRFFYGSKRSYPTSQPRILHVGRIAPEKNTEEVIRAFVLLKREIPDALLTIVGDGPVLIDLKREASELNVADSINFMGYRSRTDLPQIYHDHDLFVTASAMETQGLVALEAIATGLPAVGVDAFALPELIHHGENGLVPAAHDVPAIAAAMVKILKDREFYESASAMSIEIAAGHSHDRSVDRLEKIYRKAMVS